MQQIQTVADLIKHLQQYSQDANVLIDQFADAQEIKLSTINAGETFIDSLKGEATIAKHDIVVLSSYFLKSNFWVKAKSLSYPAIKWDGNKQSYENIGKELKGKIIGGDGGDVLYLNTTLPENRVAFGQWIVFLNEGLFEILSEEDFFTKYEPAN